MKTRLLKKSAIAVFTITTASFYFTQEQEPATENNIEEVVLVGVADIAKDRKTPVAVSTIKESAIVEKLGNQEFPELLNTTPSVYATKQGGGFGDSKISIRGFSQENTAVMVNGIPINDMEGGSVYWSNWTGIADVTSAIQVQRGLGSSKLAIASIGGTINILTRSADKKRGGNLSIGVGNDGYHKALFSYNTGLSKNGWSSSFLFSRTAGSMYADGTEFEGYNYYLAVGYRPNQSHDLQFTVTGAPQVHHQRASASTIADYIKFGGSINQPNRKYNPDWGYLKGEDGIDREYSWRRNFYHKPIVSLNWDWKTSEKSKLSTVLYGSFGRGGGMGNIGAIRGVSLNSFRNPDTNIYDFNAIINANASSTPANGQVVRRATINAHNWYGLLSNFEHKINDNWNYSIGIDGRYFKGYHYVIVSDLLGASGYLDNRDRNNPNRTIINDYSENIWNIFQKRHDNQDRIDRNYDGEVYWYGGFGQVEYSNDKFSAFVQGSLSNQGTQRIDYFIQDGITRSTSGKVMNTKTGFLNKIGYNIKGGLNYNINEQHNIFGNIGYYSKQPLFVMIYSGNQNEENDVNNEKIFSAELGYGFRSSNFTANLNLYRTSWGNRFLRNTANDTNPARTRYLMDVRGIDEIHQGIEVDATYRLNNMLSLNGMFSLGDWFYKGNAKVETLTESYEPYTPQGYTSNHFELYSDKAKVGSAAQLTAALGLTLEPISNLKVDANWRYVDKLYAKLDIVSFSNEATAKKGVLELPSYNLLDLGISYKLNIGNNQSFTFRGNVYNVLDTYYIAESNTNRHAKTEADFANKTDYHNYLNTQVYKGVDTSNSVFFGFGRTWNVSIAFNF